MLLTPSTSAGQTLRSRMKLGFISEAQVLLTALYASRRKITVFFGGVLTTMIGLPAAYVLARRVPVHRSAARDYLPAGLFFGAGAAPARRSRSAPMTSVIFVTGPAVSKPRSPTPTTRHPSAPNRFRIAGSSDPTGLPIPLTYQVTPPDGPASSRPIRTAYSYVVMRLFGGQVGPTSPRSRAAHEGANSVTISRVVTAKSFIAQHLPRHLHRRLAVRLAGHACRVR